MEKDYLSVLSVHGCTRISTDYLSETKYLSNPIKSPKIPRDKSCPPISTKSAFIRLFREIRGYNPPSANPLRFLSIHIIKKHLNAALFEKLFTQGIRVGIGDIHGFDFGIDNHARADAARLMRAIKRGTTDAGAIYGGLDNGILLRMHAAAKLVFFAGRNP